MEDSVSESLHKKHIVNKYIMKNKENSLLKSRTKLDSLRFNYSFGDDYIDNNEKLKAFMTKTIEKLKFRRTPMSHELVSLTMMVDEHQKDALNRNSIKDARGEMQEDPDKFLKDLSPLYDGIADLQKCYLRSKSIDEDDEDQQRFRRNKYAIPISKTALSNYENPITIR